MSKMTICQDKLLQEAEKKGYLVFDDIMDMADLFDLSVSEVDKLSKGIQLRGVIVYEEEPQDTKDSDDPVFDYSRVDYEAIYDEIIEIEPDLEFVVEYIRNLPPPQHGEVQTLAIQAKNGNLHAEERLQLIHLRLALKIALSTAKRYSFNMTDAVCESFVGLRVAIDKFDPNGFAAFQSYASSWIFQNIMRECVPMWMQYYYPVHYKDRMYSVLEKYRQKYGDYLDYDRLPDEEFYTEAADQMGILPNQAKEALIAVLNQTRGRFYLDAEVKPLESEFKSCAREFPALLSCDFSSENEAYLYEFVEYNSEDTDWAKDPFQDAFDADVKEHIDNLLLELTERERQVIKLRYGLDDNKEWTLEEVGKLLGVTRERVRQIEARAKSKILRSRKRKLLESLY